MNTVASLSGPPLNVPTVAMNDYLSGYWSDTFPDFTALRDNGTISKTAPADNTTLDPYAWPFALLTLLTALTRSDAP